MPPPPCHPILGRGRGSRCLLPVFVQHQPRHRPAQWLLHAHENVSQYARTIVFIAIGRPVRLPDIRPVLPPQPTAPRTVVAASRPMLFDAGTGRVGLGPVLSSCVPPRRTRWRLPRSGYLGDEESRSEILDNQGMWRDSSRHMLRGWWCCCVASVGPGLERHSHSLALLGPTPGAGVSWFGAASAELLSSLACSLPICI
jgi:hypothetical protein